MSSSSPVVGRLLMGGVACTAHIVAIAWIGAAFTATKTLHGGAPIIHVTLEGQGFTGEASRQREVPPEQSHKQARQSSATARTRSQETPPLQRPALLRPESPSQATSSSSPSAAFPVGAPPQFPGISATTLPLSEPAANASTASPSPGAGAPLKGASGAEASDVYEAQVIAWLEQHKRHPGGVAGRIVLRFTLDRRGRLVTSSIVSADRERRLERVALSQLQEASPFPRAPPNASWRTRSFVVRLDYRSSQT